MKITLSNILIVIVLCYLATTIWSLMEVFFPKQCSKSDQRQCLLPSWTENDKIKVTGNASHQQSSNSTLPTAHWLSVLRVYALAQPLSFDVDKIPHELYQSLTMYRNDDKSDVLTYAPPLVVDPSLQASSDWVEASSSVIDPDSHQLSFTLSIEPVSIGVFRMRRIFESSMQQLTSYVIWQLFSYSIIFLYLMEEKASLLIVIPTGLSVIIELWKLARASKLSLSWRHGLQRAARSSTEQESDAIDAAFMRRLFYLMIPLCLVGACYSLLYLPHRSWYSWALKTLVNGVYAFGFLFMTPQLFLNYRLKSVAHLPWRALTYKAFNTFIDDFFAFIIKMPTSHRLACLRDDVIFVIYLYQRWLYPVDKTRVNEFGQSSLSGDSTKTSSSADSQAKVKDD